MLMNKYKKLIRLIKKSKSIALFIHKNPDGDAVGSSSGLFCCLKNAGKNVHLYSADKLSKKFDIFETKDQYKQVNEGDKYDLGIIIDCSGIDRVGEVSSILNDCKTIVRVDHHLADEKLSEFDIVEPKTSSACEVVLKLIISGKFDIDEKVASYVLYGLLTDTFAFQNQNTNQQSLNLAAFLVGKGANISELAFNAFRITNKTETNVRKLFYNNIKFESENQIAYSVMNYEELKEIGATKNDVGGESNLLTNIDSVKVGAVFCEYEKGIIDASIRSKHGPSACEIAKKFGGGGHKNAAGFTVEMEISEVIKKFIEECNKEIAK